MLFSIDSYKEKVIQFLNPTAKGSDEEIDIFEGIYFDENHEGFTFEKAAVRVILNSTTDESITDYSLLKALMSRLISESIENNIIPKSRLLLRYNNVAIALGYMMIIYPQFNINTLSNDSLNSSLKITYEKNFTAIKNALVDIMGDTLVQEGRVEQLLSLELEPNQRYNIYLTAFENFNIEGMPQSLVISEALQQLEFNDFMKLVLSNDDVINYINANNVLKDKIKDALLDKTFKMEDIKNFSVTNFIDILKLSQKLGITNDILIKNDLFEYYLKDTLSKPNKGEKTGMSDDLKNLSDKDFIEFLDLIDKAGIAKDIIKDNNKVEFAKKIVETYLSLDSNETEGKEILENTYNTYIHNYLFESKLKNMNESILKSYIKNDLSSIDPKNNSVSARDKQIEVVKAFELHEFIGVIHEVNKAHKVLSFEKAIELLVNILAKITSQQKTFAELVSIKPTTVPQQER